MSAMEIFDNVAALVFFTVVLPWVLSEWMP
jgi:hypothetical protein